MALTDGVSVGRPSGPGEASLSPGTYGQVQDAAGNVLNAVSFTYGGEQRPTPVLPDVLPSSADGARNVVFSTSSTAAGRAAGFRVLVEGMPDTDRVLVVAVPLDETRQTLTRLLSIETVVSLLVLAALAAVA